MLLDAAIYIGVLGPDALIYHLNIRMQLILVGEFKLDVRDGGDTLRKHLDEDVFVRVTF